MKQSMLRANVLIDPLVQASSHIETSIAHTTPLHYHDYYELFIITSGKCVHTVNDQDQILGKGSIVFIRPEDNHCYGFYNEEDCQFMNVNFHQEMVEYAFDYIGDRIFSQHLKSLSLPPNLMLSDIEMESAIGKGEQIRLYSTFDKPKARILAKSFLIETLTYFFLQSKSDEQQAIPVWFDSLLFQMQKKENFCIGLDKLYTISGKSRGHINRVFKQYLNTTPTNYINHLKLNYAKNLLLTTNLEILDVAFEAGFDNLSHFYHLFRDFFGMTPGSIRYK
ncbi:MAG: celD [Herbinix sp.]|jgi:AraC family cel operon transcriptional repressor|nr:celD [Herbinix sp.]